MSTHTADPQSPCYYTQAPCGCIKSLIANMPEHKKEVAKELADAARRGEAILNCAVIDIWEGRVALGHCDTCEPPKGKKRKPQPVEQMQLF